MGSVDRLGGFKCWLFSLFIDCRDMYRRIMRYKTPNRCSACDFVTSVYCLLPVQHAWAFLSISIRRETVMEFAVARSDCQNASTIRAPAGENGTGVCAEKAQSISQSAYSMGSKWLYYWWKTNRSVRARWVPSHVRNVRSFMAKASSVQLQFRR